MPLTCLPTPSPFSSSAQLPAPWRARPWLPRQGPAPSTLVARHLHHLSTQFHAPPASPRAVPNQQSHKALPPRPCPSAAASCRCRAAAGCSRPRPEPGVATASHGQSQPSPSSSLLAVSCLEPDLPVASSLLCSIAVR